MQSMLATSLPMNQFDGVLSALISILFKALNVCEGRGVLTFPVIVSFKLKKVSCGKFHLWLEYFTKILWPEV